MPPPFLSRCVLPVLISGLLLSRPCKADRSEDKASVKACLGMISHGLLSVADERSKRFGGKVQKSTAMCRGGNNAVEAISRPWVDWGNYWGTGDSSSKGRGFITSKGLLSPTRRGLRGALLDLEYQRIELIKFNLFDNNGTYQDYVQGRNKVGGPALKFWSSMRLPTEHPSFAAVGGDGLQECKGDLVRARTLTGICNDVRNPLMGSTGQLMARNAELDSTFPELGRTDLVRNRHGDRLALLTPDPQVISRRLFTRPQTKPDLCKEGFGLDGAATADCDYKKAPFFNVLAAFWIQFMTHDWFSHMEEGRNAPEFMKVGCESRKVNNVEQPLSPEEIAKLGCRPEDRIDRGFVADSAEPAAFTDGKGKAYLTRAPKTMRNTNTAWWDASQIYGYDETSVKRVKRDPADPAKLLMKPLPQGATDAGYLPLLA
ncbi:MAG: oxygenase, partial [Bryobacteraceae bacterium]|nr:oxygenase [Bryobacteraceae bacterium]